MTARACVFPQVLELLAAGEAHRHFGETKMNVNSSRSHTLFRMVRHLGGLAVGPCSLYGAATCGDLQCPRYEHDPGSVFRGKCTVQMYLLRWQVVESRAREQSADEHDSGAVWVSALTLVDLAGRYSRRRAPGSGAMLCFWHIPP